MKPVSRLNSAFEPNEGHEFHDDVKWVFAYLFSKSISKEQETFNKIIVKIFCEL
ncbi:hypothetical protein Syun_009553 [Stephania yunnanensis]|uniref:Uncharacterized protein n=1 Tax=Stephania yunnanensis TaxID=152371 RepID=A0AAP0KGW1_9MAGN